jgi:DHA3 family macrolide efflux protein-like MFS transporter
MIILLVFSFYFFKRSILMIYVLASLLGIFLSLYMPASVAIRKEIVKPDLLLFANSSIDVAYEIGGVIGMGLSGILLTYYSFSTVLIINSICFFLAILSLFKMKVNSNLERPLPLNLINNFFNELKSGIKYVYTHESLMKIFLAQLLITAGLMTSPILLVDFATHVLKANVSQFGQLEALFSFGVVCGGLLNPYLTQQLGVRLILLIEMFCLGILFIVFSTLFNIQCGLVIYYFIGFCFSGLALISTIAQKMTEQAYQGRAQATFNSAAGIAILIIYIAINLVSHYVTIDFLYLCQAALILCSLVLLSQKSYYEIMFIKS